MCRGGARRGHELKLCKLALQVELGPLMKSVDIEVIHQEKC